MLEKLHAIGYKPVLLLGKTTKKEQTKCEILTPRCRLTDFAKDYLQKIGSFYEYLCEGWNQDPHVNEELITLHLTPCDPLEGPSNANMEGQAEQTDMEGQAEQTDMEGQAEQTDMEGQAEQTDMEGQAEQTDMEGQAKQTDMEGQAEQTDMSKKSVATRHMPERKKLQKTRAKTARAAPSKMVREAGASLGGEEGEKGTCATHSSSCQKGLMCYQ
ncbi:uncharacterized protein LOC115583521 [Sparus aurata]|uniref:uncharacterized protein LOC115583521 n=1 Tax=Sparus aurata TaxID=8175 RepID=UPI0011C12C5D|nr:uncharacterized protein LOC115583521 [Sparus aurata]